MSKTGNKAVKAPEHQLSVGTVKIGGKTYTKKAVTLPFLLVQDNQTVTIRIEEAIRDAKGNKDRKNAEGKKMDEPMRICPVSLVSDVPASGKNAAMPAGLMANLICGKVVESNLSEHYPDNGYVGKVFEITCTGKVAGKRHKGYIINELTAD